MGQLGRSVPFKPLVNTYRTKRFDVTMGGTLTTAGAITRESQRALIGTLTTAGALVRAMTRALDGTLTTAGALSAVKTALVSLAGTLTIAGSLAAQAAKALSGTLTTVGGVSKQTAKSAIGTVTTAGGVTTIKAALLALTGTLTTSGTVSTQLQKVAGGVLSTAGVVVTLTTRTLTGVVTFAGTIAGVVGGGGPPGYWTTLADINTRWRAYLEQLYLYSLDGRRDLTTLVRRWLNENQAAGEDDDARLKSLDDDSKS